MRPASWHWLNDGVVGMRARRVVITGRVQGVGYRDWMVKTARTLGIAGWVRNRGDGGVEALVYGETDAVEELLRACRRGPRLATVSRVEEEWAEPPTEPGFFRRA
jgi:acylphosphatase